MFRTQKYNNACRHELDRFNTKAEAIESANILHNPDWPTGQGIKVLDDEGQVLWDSANVLKPKS